MELVTGRAGSPHITSQQDRQKHQGIWGTGAYILNTGNNLEAVVQSSNNIQIKDGALMSQGALFSVKVGTVDEVTIANGSQGMMRKDVIVARYTYNQGTNTENAEWAVVQGTPAASNPQIPQITEGDIQAGDATVDTSVFIVTLDGINITSVDVVPELAPDIAELKALIDELNGKTKDTFLSRRYHPTNSGTVIQSGFGFSMTFAPEEIPGYEILAVSSYSTGHDNFVVASVTTNNITGKNTLGSSYGIPKDAYIELVYTKL